MNRIRPIAISVIVAIAFVTSGASVFAQTSNNTATEYSKGRSAPPTEPSVVVQPNAANAAPKVMMAARPAARVEQRIVRPRPVGVSGPVTMPSQEVLLTMVRAALSAVNQANFTDNYSVLHAMSTPQLQARVSVSQFGKAFAELRGQNLDLSPSLVLDPQFSPAPVLVPGGALKLKGVFPSRPFQISFAVDYVPVDGYWLIDSLSVSAQRPDNVASAPPAASPVVVASADPNAVPVARQASVSASEAAPTMAFAAPAQNSAKPAKTSSESGGGIGGPYVPGVYVQVSSQRSEADAQAALTSLQKAYPSIVRPEQSIVRSANLGNKGTYYRAQVGPVSPSQARQICGDLKAVGTECFIHYN